MCKTRASHGRNMITIRRDIIYSCFSFYTSVTTLTTMLSYFVSKSPVITFLYMGHKAWYLTLNGSGRFRTGDRSGPTGEHLWEKTWAFAFFGAVSDLLQQECALQWMAGRADCM